jgi:dihydrofolate synthase/folylpolyglutamate synthase
VWLDGGHNPSAARQIASFVKQGFDDGKPLHMVFASLATKHPPRMLEPFRGLLAEVHAVPIPDHACFTPSDLVEIAGNLGFRAFAHDDVEQALGAISPDARVLIFGSLYLAGAVLAANDQLPD